MKREIKFRGKVYHNPQKVYLGSGCQDGEWVYGDLHLQSANPHIHIKEHHREPIDVETIGQFTGLHDKNGTPIYEGDIVEFYDTKSYCINPDCEPHIRGYGTYIYKRICEVEFVDGVFGVESRNAFVDLEVLAWCGLHTEELDDMKEMEESDAYFDTNGYNIDDSIVGIKVIGNIYDNLDLLK